MRKLILSKLFVVTSLLTVLLGACNKSAGDDWEDLYYTSKATISNATIGYNQTTNSIITDGNPKKSWKAEIETSDRGNWCSFDQNGILLATTGQPGDEIRLFVTPNSSPDARRAVIKLTFSDKNNTVIEVSFIQYGYSEGANYERDWGEQPEMTENDDYIHKTYYTTLSNGKTVRNYSICFDIDHKVSRWVAFPLHDVYTQRGNYEADQSNGRTNAWAFDDAVTEYMASGSNGVNYGKYRFISTYDSSTGAYDTATDPIIKHEYQQNVGPGAYNDREENRPLNLNRGHMLPSASRYNTFMTNAQTFYATNMMPQEGNFNSGAWSKLESASRSATCSDTLYVVVGTLFEEGAKRITARQRDITVPSHCYQLWIRTKSGYSGKRIDEITDPDQLICIGFIFENNNKSKDTPLSSAAVSVAEIEERAGFTFFRNLNPAIADKVKNQCNLSDWPAIR